MNINDEDFKTYIEIEYDRIDSMLSDGLITEEQYWKMIDKLESLLSMSREGWEHI